MSLTIIYWISTGLLSLLYFVSALLYATKPQWVRQTLVKLNFPAPYLLPLLIVVKVLAPIAILSRIDVPLSDFAYAGMFLHLILSALAHLGVRSMRDAAPAAIGLLLLVVSFTTQNAARDVPSVDAPVLWAQH